MNNSGRRFELQILLRRASVVILNLGLNKLAVEAPKCVSKRKRHVAGTGEFARCCVSK
jgi:hypothetical protein